MASNGAEAEEQVGCERDLEIVEAPETRKTLEPDVA